MGWLTVDDMNPAVPQGPKTMGNMVYSPLMGNAGFFSSTVWESSPGRTLACILSRGTQAPATAKASWVNSSGKNMRAVIWAAVRV